MDALLTILQLMLALVIILAPLLFLVRLLVACFSGRVRDLIRKRWWLHLLWGFGSIFCVLILFDGSGPNPAVARRSKTETLIKNVQEAISSYETEYGVPPQGKDNASLMKVLLGDNSRKIEFIVAKPNDMNSRGEMLDAWGTPLLIKMNHPEQPWIQSAGPDKKWGTRDDFFLADPNLGPPF